MKHELRFYYSGPTPARMGRSGRSPMFSMLLLWLLGLLAGAVPSFAQTSVTIDPAARLQVIDGFGTCLSGDEGENAWMQNLYYDDAGCSILRMDLVPRFVSPYSDNTYNSPWFHNNPPLPGPDGNNVRTYTNASDYTRLFNSNRAQIAVMGPDITANTTKFDYTSSGPRAAGLMAKAGKARKAQLGDFKLTGSIWSPAPWLKVASGNKYDGAAYPLPAANAPFPFIWTDNFTGGKLDVSNTPRSEFFDGVQNTSALTQFARSTAAYVKGFQDKNDVSFYSISIQNELNFETFYNSCTYPLSAYYIAALKAVRAEFDKYDDLKGIRIMGPEDLLGDNAYALWEYSNASNPVDQVVHKNLQYLTEIAKDPAAVAAIDYFCIHGYAPDGVNSAGANSTLWDWWANGWATSPAPGIPGNVKGFKDYGKKSWMTETSGEQTAWLAPSTGFPSNGAFSVALKMHQAIVTGFASGWVYWQFSDGRPVAGESLTDAQSLGTSPKYNAFKHFSRYIRPNAVRLGSSVASGAGVSVSSYVHDADKSLAIVLINGNSSARTVTVNVPTLPFALTSFDTYTSSNNSYWQTSTQAVSQQKVTVTVPAYGVCTLYGKGTTTTTPPTGLRDPENPASTQPGLDYKYYEGTWSNLPNFTSLTAVKSGSVATPTLTPRNRNDNFGFSYTGFVNVPTDGSYTFYTSSDDGSKLFIGSTEVVANDGLHAPQERSGSIGLKAGKHAVTVVFFEAGGGELLTVSYAGPGLAKQIVPASAWFRANGTPPPTGTFSGTYRLTARHSGKALEVSGVSTADGANVQQATSNNAFNQQWVITATTDGYSKLLNKATGKALDVDSLSSADGANVHQWSYVNGGNQQWKIEPTSGGFYKLTARHSGKVLEVSGTSQADGANVQQWTYTNGDNQQWQIDELSTVTALVAEERAAGPVVEVYPNPTTDGLLRLMIRVTEPQATQLKVVSMAGRQLLSQPLSLQAGDNPVEVKLGQIPTGVYLMTMQLGQQRVVKKVFVE